MTPFLKQVASHYYDEGRIGERCFVFPNRRSAVFFRKYLGEVVRDAGAGSPLRAPACLTINDFFYQVYGGEVTDRIRLLLELYEAYKQVFPRAEALDEFIFWGEIILADFDDVDKYLVDAKDLFANVSDFKDIQDDYSHLSPTQRDAVDRFLSHFRDQAGRLTVRLDVDEHTVKARFLQIWNVLYPLYETFRKRLKEKGMSYEGMVYRDLASRLRDGGSVVDVLSGAFPGGHRLVFIGLNALNECEKTVLGKMLDAGVAEFCWDYASEAIRDPRNKSSFFMKDNVVAFPPAFRTDPEGLGKPVFHVVSVPSAVGQAKVAPTILGGCGGDPVETAFVLPDEHLLMPLLSAIPSRYDSINVTMGCPLTGGAVYALMSAVSAMQLHLRQKDSQGYFYHRDVRSILASSLFRAALTPGEEEIVEAVKKAGRYYIRTADLQGGPLLDLVFRPVIHQPKEGSREQNKAIACAFAAIVSYIGWKIRGVESLLLELDFAKRYLMSLQVLEDIGLDVLLTMKYGSIGAAWATLIVTTLAAALSFPYVMYIVYSGKEKYE